MIVPACVQMYLDCLMYLITTVTRTRSFRHPPLSLSISHQQNTKPSGASWKRLDSPGEESPVAQQRPEPQVVSILGCPPPDSLQGTLSLGVLRGC